MFEVEMYEEERSWNGLRFVFDSLEEAQQFIQGAMAHFDRDSGDYEKEEEKVLIASIRYSQKFTTAKE